MIMTGKFHIILIILIMSTCVAFQGILDKPIGDLDEDKFDLDSCDLAIQLEEFRDCVLHADTGVLMKYISFPIKEKSVWQLVNLFRQGAPVREKSTFMDEDFIAYFNDVFNDDLRKGLEDTSLSMLLTNGEYLTESYEGISDDDMERYSYKHISRFDKATDEVIFILLYEFVDTGVKYETSVSYYLQFVNCDLKLKKVLVIG